MRLIVRTFMRPWRSLGPLPLLAVLALLLPACAARQDDGAAALLDPANSARQEFVADIQLGAGRSLLALQGYDKALAARPGDVGLLVKKGQALLRLHRPEAALEAFRLAVAASPESSGAHYGAGQASERLGQGEAARQSFERAVALAPESWRARCHLGVLLMNQGQPDKAVEQFLAALALPRFQTQAVAQAGAWTGIPAEAQAVAGREELLNNLAVAQVLSGRPEAAVKTFRQAMQGSRDPGRSANNLGLLLVRLGRPVEALEAFRSGGSDARALNNLGYALYLQGEVVRARALFEKALDLSPAYYETAGENLKQAVRGAPGNAGPGAATTAASPGGAAAGGRPAGHGQEDKNIGEGAASQDLERLSLTGRGAVGLHFGQASLLGEGAARHWAY